MHGMSMAAPRPDASTAITRTTRTGFHHERLVAARSPIGPPMMVVAPLTTGSSWLGASGGSESPVVVTRAMVPLRQPRKGFPPPVPPPGLPPPVPGLPPPVSGLEGFPLGVGDFDSLGLGLAV